MEREMNLTEIASTALSAAYVGIFLIDLTKDQYTPIKVNDKIQAILENIPSAQEALVSAMYNTVFEEQKEQMLAFVDLETLPLRMATRRNIDMAYKGVLSGWIRGSFIEVERDSKKNVVKVLYAYQLITEPGTVEMEQQEKAVAQNEMIRNLTKNKMQLEKQIITLRNIHRFDKEAPPL